MLTALVLALGLDAPWAADFARSYDDIMNAFNGFVAEHPGEIDKTSLLRTQQGRDLAIFGLGKRDSQDRVLLLCNHHGDEQWVAQLCLDFTRWLLWSNGRDPEITALLSRVGIDVLPIGNPDGFARGSRYNARGNDINRNFPYQWGHTESGTSNARPGPAAASESETQALMQYQKAFRDAGGRWVVTFNYHLRYESSDGDNFILLPWAYTRRRTLTESEMAQYRPFLPSRTEAPTFTVDTVPNVFYSCPGTHTDWTWAELGSPALTMELGHSYELPERDEYVTEILERENLPVFKRFLAGVAAVVAR